ncbi:MAG: primosomal protein N' [Clostridiales bacterium]|nr:primosomal protein N' [Clostridiales bacterium]
MDLYANVIIDITHTDLDRVFQYRIPDGMEDVVSAGVAVKVPFGRGNALRQGYVVEVTDIAEYDTSKIKDVDSVAEGSLPIEAQLIALAAWMREDFGGTMNQALKTVLPVRRKTAERERRMIHLVPCGKEAVALLAECERKHQTARVRLLAALMEQSPLPYETVTGKLNVTAAVIRAMEEKGMVRVEHIRDYRNPLDRMKKKGETVALNSVQQGIADDILSRRKRGDLRPSLIHGVTGSGKTEVYIALIEAAVRERRQAIVLIPEIALTFQTVLRFYNHFGDRVSILNSRMSAGERYDQYERAKDGRLDVIIGPRSALFAPFDNLGFIIIDEEHESTYKSETVPCYHARETAIARAKMCGAMVVLGSATPSIESYARAEAGEYQLYQMMERVSRRQLPVVEIVDMREELRAGNRSPFSERLEELMEDRLAKHEQIMLFLNRRGMAGFVSCRSCGHEIKCPHCDVSLSLHNGGRLVCHYCGYTQPMVTNCPECGSKYIGTFKAGTQKMEQYVRRRFPEARVLRMDLDTTRQKDSYEKILSAFADQEADILIGTQMIVKGHDFPNITLVGVLAADLSLYISDYRASERTFELLTQAAGRAGRGEKAGEVVIQTYQPGHFAVVTAAAQDYQAFYREEIAFRKLMKYPPVWQMLVIHMSSANEGLVNRAADVLQYNLREKIREDAGFQLVGPADAVISKVNDIYRKIIYVKSADYAGLVRIKDELDAFVRENADFKSVAVQFDFNPMDGL